MYFFLKKTEMLKLISAGSKEKGELQIQIVVYTVHVSVHVCRCIGIVCTIFWTLKKSFHVVVYGTVQGQTRSSEKYFKEMNEVTEAVEDISACFDEIIPLFRSLSLNNINQKVS